MLKPPVEEKQRRRATVKPSRFEQVLHTFKVWVFEIGILHWVWRDPVENAFRLDQP